MNLNKFALFILLSVFATKGYSQCSIVGNSQVCTNVAAVFTTDCPVPEGNAWYVNNQFLGSAQQLNHVFTAPGTYTVMYEYDEPYEVCVPDPEQPGSGVMICHTEYNSGSATKTVTVTDSPIQPVVQSNASVICSPAAINFTVTNPSAGVTYSWSSVPAGYSGSGTQVTFDHVAQTTEFVVTATKGACSLQTSNTIILDQTLAQPILDPTNQYRKRILNATAYPPDHYWQASAQGQDISNNLVAGFAVTESGSYFVRKYSEQGSCWTSASGAVNVVVNYQPPLAIFSEVKKSGYSIFYFRNNDKAYIFQFADYYWVNGPSDAPEIIRPYNDVQSLIGDKIFSDGTYYLKGRDRATNTWGPTLTLNVDIREDDDINWIHTKSFDGTIQGTGLTVVSESKAYFDEAGSSLQTQAKNFTKNTIFASQDLRDQYGRVVGSTLSAPIKSDVFNYNEGFLLGSDGQNYDYNNFDLTANIYNPAPVDNKNEGTIGWYYSENNTLESHVPATQYPYTRSEFYTDGTGEVKRGAGVGDQHRMGKGHEVLSGTFPVHNELDDYLSRRVVAVPGIVQDGSLKHEGVQQVARDQNGKFAISISDKSGKAVMSARPGSQGDHVLEVNNTITASRVAGSANYSEMIYLYLLHPQIVTITGTGSYTIEDIVAGQAFTPAGNWPVGFYRILLASGEITVSYKNYYLDVSYQFYDDTGKLKSSVSPNGFNKWKEDPNPTVNYPTIDKTTYQYNFQGLLLSMTEPDAGKTEYLYRKDGKIRFSQNALQRELSRFSYTNYDYLGRPVESGEYIGTQYTFNNLQSQLEFTGQVDFEDNDVKDWIRTYYDAPAAAITDLPSTYVQDYLHAAVSWTENANIQTWYSYDELGRVTWMAQRPKDMLKTFVTTYEYDFLGNVLKVYNAMFLGGSPVNPFYHHYEYDADRRLSKAYTSVDGTNKKLRATYDYYLHGPLKRIELGDGLQGVDFVYNIHGWLTQINHPDKAQDPGNDGNDAFGMILDYYESDISGLIVPGPTASNDPVQFHRMGPENRHVLASHQPLIRFNELQTCLQKTYGRQASNLPSENLRQASLEHRTWNLEPQTWNLEPGTWNLEPGTRRSNDLRTLREFSAESPRYKQMMDQVANQDQ